jgi:probable DNA repair protein
MPTSNSALSSELITAIRAGAWVLTPNQRSAHWLKLLYANYALAQGLTAWATPAIYSFGTFVSELWRRQGSADERVLTSEQSQLLWERIVAASRWSELLLNPQAAAGSSFRAWERLQAWCISRNDLASLATTTDSSETSALLEWHDRFSELCSQRSWLPVALLPQRLLELTPVSGTLTPQHLITLGEELLPNQHKLLTHFRATGVQWQQLPQAQLRGTVSATKCESSEHELQSAAAWSRQQLLAGSKSIGIVMPDLDTHATQIRRVFGNAFAQDTRTLTPSEHSHGIDRAAQTSFAIATYHRLADFPIARAALDLLQLLNGRASSALAGSILRSPFLRASLQEASLRALTDARLRSQAREHYDLTALARVAVNCPKLNQCLDDALALLLAVPSRGFPSAMAERFIALWRAFGWPGEQVLDSDEQQIVARLQSCLAEFGALDELLGPLTFAGAVREFEQLTRNVSFEPRSAPTPITIIDVNAVAGLQFDAVWVCATDETRWPPPASPDPFIPIVLQARVGMPNATASLVHEHARKQFLQLQTIAAETVFSWARTDRDVEIQPSPWLAEISSSLHDQLSEVEFAARIFAARPALEVIEERSAPALLDQRARGGTRIFELQSLCPFRAFAELRLDAKPLHEVAPNIDASERGVLIHAALAEVWQLLGGSEGLRARTTEQLEVLVRTALGRNTAKLLDGASSHRVRMLQIEQELATERILALFELDRTRTPFRVVGRPETLEKATVGALAFELRLDRMDELLDAAHLGSRVIIDYKTGHNVSTSSWTRDRPEQPQLPLYAVTHPQALAAVTFVTMGAKGVAYQGLAQDDGVLPGVSAFNDKHLPAPYEQWHGLLNYWHSVITRLANQFASGAAQVDPLPTACRYCHLSTLCRINDQDHTLSANEEDAS